MIRVLVIIAVTGFLVSVACISVAVGLAGPQVIAHGGWAWSPPGWGPDAWRRDGFRHRFDDHAEGWEWRRRHWGDEDAGPQTSREIAWNGGERLGVDLDADVSYSQAPGPAKVVVSGPQAAVADVRLDNGDIGYAAGRDHDVRLTIQITAPAVKRFDLDGAGTLAIAGYKQDSLTLNLSGDTDVSAKGEAKAVDLAVSGSANADLSALKAQSAQVDISGSGDATLAPTDAARIDISGSGDVTLLTHPPKLETDISGSGRIRQEEAPAAARAGGRG
jgi:hypothetical protein